MARLTHSRDISTFQETSVTYKMSDVSKDCKGRRQDQIYFILLMEAVYSLHHPTDIIVTLRTPCVCDATDVLRERERERGRERERMEI